MFYTYMQPRGASTDAMMRDGNKAQHDGVEQATWDGLQGTALLEKRSCETGVQEQNTLVADYQRQSVFGFPSTLLAVDHCQKRRRSVFLSNRHSCSQRIRNQSGDSGSINTAGENCGGHCTPTSLR